MNWWGFVLYTQHGFELFADFGYETEEDAQMAMDEYIAKEKPDDSIICVVEQRFEDLDDYME